MAGLPPLTNAISVPWVDAYVVLEGAPLAASAGAAKTRQLLAGISLQCRLRGAELMAQHASLQSRLAATGALVQNHLTRLVNAIRIRVPADRLAAVAALPGVTKVVRARHYTRALTHAVPYLGTPSVWESQTFSADGRNVRIGVIDTGIDYTHADFGGSGRIEDFTRNDHTRIEPGTFPTAKVVGGYDFAGDDYDSSNPISAIPVPDPDPIDNLEAGHGTHVAGIAAGFGVLTNGQTYAGEYSASLDFHQFKVGPGVAPRALLYALKIFGRTGTTDLTLEALEWAADPNGDFDLSDRLEVVNLSLGEAFANGNPEDNPEVAAANHLAQLGCVVVCAAGNTGNIFYSTASPGAASRAISVGNSLAPLEVGALEVLAPASIAAKYYAVEGFFTAPLTKVGPIIASVVYAEPPEACGPIQNAPALKGNIALIDRGTCFFTNKIQLAQDAGALAVIMVNNVAGDPIIMGGTSSAITIPGVMISLADGKLLKDQLTNQLTVRLDASLSLLPTNRMDNLASTSSRGPVGMANYLKPEIVAPGTDIFSAAAGAGTAGVAFTGTSMAAPMVAGAAALLRQIHPDWNVEDIKSALMNTAILPHDEQSNPYPESLTGAGRLRVDQAAALEVTAAAANADGNIALSLGSLVLASAFQTNCSILLTNHGRNNFNFQVVVSNTIPQAGVSLTPVSQMVSIPAHTALSVPFIFRADPREFDLKPDAITPLTLNNYPRHVLYEASGQIWFLSDSQTLHLPYYANVRAASVWRAGATNIVLAPELNGRQHVTVTIPITGTSAMTQALVSVFELGTTLPNYHGLSGDNAVAQLLAVGAASDIAHSGSLANAQVFFGVATAASWPSPQLNYLELGIQIDTNEDGLADFITFNTNLSQTNASQAEADVFMTGLQSLDIHGDPIASYLGGYLNVFPAGQADTAPFNNSVMVESVQASQLGLSATHPRFRYRVVTFGSLPNISITGWITFDAARPVIDTARSGREGTPVHNDGQPIEVDLDRQAAADAKQRLPGVLLLHHHNLEGQRYDVVRLDLANDDLDNDGLPDWWEMKFFHNLTTADQNTDFDGDGFNDRDEYLAGTDPTDPNSCLKITEAVRTADGGMKLSWQSVAGKTYQIMHAGSLVHPVWQTVGGNQSATPPINTFTDAGNLSSGAGFYRILIP